MSDHEKYPNDIIAGTFSYHLDKNLVLQRMTDFKQKNAGGKNNVPGLVFNFARPANGCGGTLYPAHTFTDKRFFDEELMMRLSGNGHLHMVVHHIQRYVDITSSGCEF